MRILLCSEFYAPSVGGVQEVVKQVAERLVLRGHDVTVATTKLPHRSFDTLNRVKIKGFEVAGNLAYGMVGEVDAYRDFVTSTNFDVVMIKAAQQWTFDALWPVLPQLKVRKVFIPCGFSGLYEPAFAEYFRKMPDILRQFDHLIFYASDYRDINFTKEQGLYNFSVIPNGASEIEFFATLDPSFRGRHGIGKDGLLFLTVGSFTGAKGHFEVVSAFEQAVLDRPATLILNGNRMTSSPLKPILKHKLSQYTYGDLKVVLKTRVKKYAKSGLRGIGIIDKVDTVEGIAERINKSHSNKRVLITDLPRAELIQAFMAADLFVFASNIEYSPLVLFEAAAAGTPFLSVPVGNAEEIAQWTGGGAICPAPRDGRGYTRVDPKVLAEHMTRMAKDRALLNKLGATGKKNWAERYTWDKIVVEYEKVLRGV